ncbi:MAG: RNA methyltransferase [Prevotella sp.]|nr:RNA methyltransferase [Prevotella sp.]
MDIERIESTQNARIKHLLALQGKSALRREEGLFVVEGRRELMHCLNAGFDIAGVFYCPEIQPFTEEKVVFNKGTQLFSLSRKVYEKAAYRGSTEGVIAIVRERRLTFDDLQLPDNQLIIVVEGVEKPGNLGAILRTADGAGADAVVFCDAGADPYNPNLIRSSMGAVFSVPVVCSTSGECIAFLKGRGIRILTAQLQDSEPYYSADMTRPTAIVVGNEAAGLTDVWRENADGHVLIPMLGRCDSLNVSASAAILVYEAVRQRRGQSE